MAIGDVDWRVRGHNTSDHVTLEFSSARPGLEGRFRCAIPSRPHGVSAPTAVIEVRIQPPEPFGDPPWIDIKGLWDLMGHMSRLLMVDVRQAILGPLVALPVWRMLGPRGWIVVGEPLRDVVVTGLVPIPSFTIGCS